MLLALKSPGRIKERSQKCRFSFRHSMSNNFEILEHTADVKIRVWGQTKEELFENAVLAMMSVLAPVTDLSDRTELSQIVKVKASDFETLLIDFLNEVLYLTQTEKAIFDKIKISKLTDTEITSEIFGKRAERFGEDIKAATYHNLEVSQNQVGVWEAIILFDV